MFYKWILRPLYVTNVLSVTAVIPLLLCFVREGATPGFFARCILLLAYVAYFQRLGVKLRCKYEPAFHYADQNISRGWARCIMVGGKQRKVRPYSIPLRADQTPTKKKNEPTVINYSTSPSRQLANNRPSKVYPTFVDRIKTFIHHRLNRTELKPAVASHPSLGDALDMRIREKGFLRGGPGICWEWLWDYIVMTPKPFTYDDTPKTYIRIVIKEGREMKKGPSWTNYPNWRRDKRTLL